MPTPLGYDSPVSAHRREDVALWKSHWADPYKYPAKRRTSHKSECFLVRR